MVAFSVNKGISVKLAILVYKELERNEAMIRKAVNMEVRGYVENRKGIIEEKVDSIKEEVWNKVVSGFNKQKIVDGLTYEQGVERYTKRTLSTYLKDIYSKKQKESFVDIDILDGRNRDNMDEYGDGRTVFMLTQSVINSSRSKNSPDHRVLFDEFVVSLVELYLTNISLYEFCSECFNKCTNERIGRTDELKKRRAKFTSEEQELFKKFLKECNEFTPTEVDTAFKMVDKMRKTTPMQSKEKDLEIKHYDVSEFLTEGGILSCEIKGEYSTTYFDLSTCSMRGKKNEKSTVDLKTSKCRVIGNIPSNKKIYKIRIEDYIQYAFDNTSVYDENIDTELLSWCGKYYIFILPSGKKYGFCKAHKEYMTNVRFELLANLMYELTRNKGVVIAMDDTYLYFCPNSKPRWSAINAKMFNGKTIKMKISEADNFSNEI